ncbi:efflux RND transporter periplasmic adaptor subunit [Rhodopirellula sallentina]|uniref:M50 family peptidase n=1 Tax=Rhodopirellula sallentina SM41 TaxID=1263870 RepID=M5U2I9_9BACT|nr:M50 family peptidase [Rhodopirellula sallentina]EMI52071.1 M50 family peptidase [Rhodopirellula sallentina SM41]
MSGASLRRDLHVSPLSGDRDLVVVDDIGGRFARIKKAVWQGLREQNRTTPNALSGDRRSEEPATSKDNSWLWQQAAEAGWTESRSATRLNAAFSLLSIRVPIASIDPVARRLVRWSDLVFSLKAVLFWITAAMVGMIMIAVRWDSWSGSIPTLSAYLQSLRPLTVGAIFVVTKAIHELGHAIACRRLGSRCGVAGIWVLCLMPCPYVDVTEVWRQPNAMRRAAVMAAGIMAEGVLCVLAIWAWILSGSTEVQLAAMNIVLVCGVSTILFNANPLMRYDGYFILSDLVDSTNLRAEARRAWHRVLVEPVSRWYRLGVRVWALLGYHVAAALYRVVLTLAIAAMLLSLADRWGAWRLAATLLAFSAMRIVWKKVTGGYSVWSGKGAWAAVSKVRRRGLLLAMIALLIAGLCVPLPRYRHVEGVLRCRDTHNVYLPPSGTVTAVNAEVGARVRSGQVLARVADTELALEVIATSGQARVLEHRSRVARLASLQSRRVSSASMSPSSRQLGQPSAAPELHWDVLDAARNSVSAKQDELAKRQRSLEVVSPVDGVVLPSEDLAMAQENAHRNPMELFPAVGHAASDRITWCRVASSDRMQLCLAMDASDQHDVHVGCDVRFRVPGQHAKVFRSTVSAVSPLHANNMSENADSANANSDVIDQQNYQAVCDLPNSFDVPIESIPRLEGLRCDTVVHLSPRPGWRDIWQAVCDLMGV